jgi:hypothetical protein
MAEKLESALCFFGTGALATGLLRACFSTVRPVLLRGSNGMGFLVSTIYLVCCLLNFINSQPARAYPMELSGCGGRRARAGGAPAAQPQIDRGMRSMRCSA